MNRSTLARNGIAGAIAGLGLAIGGVTLATAETNDTTTTTASSAERPGGHGGQMHEKLAATLASELDMDQAKVETALETVHESLRPEKPADGSKPTPPTEAQRDEMKQKLAAALAEELSVSEDKVSAALEVAQEQGEADRAERKTEHRAELETRLDAAVADGSLTDADKESVLKAFDADLLGGGPGGHGGPGGPGGR